MTGIVVDYDGATGFIVSNVFNKQVFYLFLSSDTKDKIQIGDYVEFNGEIIQTIPRAFFIKKQENFDVNKCNFIKIK